MTSRWYQEAVIYSVDVSSFQDSDGDGRGDLPGLISRLDYLSRLGVSCLWLNPIHPSPGGDNGYDISDYYGIDPALGSLGDFAELTRGRKSAASGSSSTWSSTTPPTSIPGSCRRAAARIAVPRLVCLERRGAADRHSGHRLPGRAERDLDLRRAGAGAGTSTASTTSSPTSTGPIQPYGRRSPRSWASGCSWALPASGSTPRRSSSSRSPGVDPGPTGLFDPGLLAARDPVAARRLGAALRGQCAAERGRAVSSAVDPTARATGRR